METWAADARYTWGAFPLGPVSNSLEEQDFLWDRAVRSPSNFDLDVAAAPPATSRSSGPPSLSSRLDREVHAPSTIVPAACQPLRGGCLVPPLATCRDGRSSR